MTSPSNGPTATQDSVKAQAGLGSPDPAPDETRGTLDSVEASPPAETPERDLVVSRGDRRKPRRRKVIRRILAAAAAIVLVFSAVTGVSIVHALTAPGRDPVGVKFVEWLRGHGVGGPVNTVERWWYTHHPPPVGGHPRHGIPQAQPPTAPATRATPGTLPTTTTVPARPTDLVPIASPALAGEGVWQPSGKLVGGSPALYETFLRPDPVHTSLVTGAVWMNTHLLKAALYNGLQEPGGGPWAHGAHIAPADDAALVAAFNGGFRLGDSRGGYMTEGRTVRPLVSGRGSFVIRRDGTVDVGQWGRDDTMTADVVAVRQNLDLIVDGGRPVPGLLANDNSRWGATLGGKVFVWRSGVGVDSKGNVIYVAGNGLNITTLADVLARAGAVRAIELDINSEWVSFYTYTGTTPADIQGQKLTGAMQRPPDRYLRDGPRDFFALFAR